MEGLDKINDTLVTVQIELAKVITKLDAIGTLDSKVAVINDATIRNTDSVKAAHHRLDKFDKTLFWFMTTIGSCILLALITFVIKGGLVK